MNLGLGEIITSIGGLGTAAFGLVDASKALWGGVNHIGFGGIKAAVSKLTSGKGAGLTQKQILATLQSNWFNGTDLASQKSIAKSLIKLNMSEGNATALAAATGVDSTSLTAVATKIAAGSPLEAAESNVFARFDFIITALLDEAYMRSDQVYRNWTRAFAMVIAVVLAVAGGIMLNNGEFVPKDIGESLLVGLLATPLAPIAKDVSSALSTAVNTLQAVKK